MKRDTIHGVCLGIGLLAASAAAGALDFERVNDAANDRVIRRTDAGNNGTLNPQSNLPDLLELRLGGWDAPAAANDPYIGQWDDSKNASLLRLDIVLDGLINPPGTLGLGAQPFDPFVFGPSPVFGFVEFDIDRNRDTGGECSGATLRYLANVARFGALPEGSIASRCAVTSLDYDPWFSSGPQFERSGADYSLVLCGCFGVTVVNTFGDTNTTFEAGDTWIVRGRFFQRAGGLSEASGAWGGSSAHAYDPQVNLWFSHDIESNRTTVTLVYPLTMQGAAELTGQPLQSSDLNVNNHTSVSEAMQDIIDGALDPVSTCGLGLSSGWAFASIQDHLQPDRWRVRALVGTSYDAPKDSIYVWTDVGFEEKIGDFTADSNVDAADVLAWTTYLVTTDGSATDADGAINGSVTVPNFGNNFCLFDVSGDGLVDLADAAIVAPPASIPGDANDDCSVDGADLSVLLSTFGKSVAKGTGADFNSDAMVNGADLSVLLSNFGQTCP